MMPFAATVQSTPIPDFATSIARRKDAAHSLAVDLDGEQDWAKSRFKAAPVDRPDRVRPIALLGSLEVVRDPLRGALRELLSRCTLLGADDLVDGSGVVLAVGDADAPPAKSPFAGISLTAGLMPAAPAAAFPAPATTAAAAAPGPLFGGTSAAPAGTTPLFGSAAAVPAPVFGASTSASLFWSTTTPLFGGALPPHLRPRSTLVLSCRLATLPPLSLQGGCSRARSAWHTAGQRR